MNITRCISTRTMTVIHRGQIEINTHLNTYSFRMYKRDKVHAQEAADTPRFAGNGHTLPDGVEVVRFNRALWY